MPFDHLVFFADAGNGDQFALAVRGGQIRSPDVFVWNHEDDSRSWAAPDVRTYVEWWMTGRITT
ncbi:MAG: SMI1/KNR4 family protein [Myxococcales bacterium]|nr:SMI1/KNR4 family protein [Myxococcales bacterium]